MTDRGLCPCNSGKLYSNCCESLLTGDKNAITASLLTTVHLLRCIEDISSIVLEINGYKLTRKIAYDFETR